MPQLHPEAAAYLAMVEDWRRRNDVPPWHRLGPPRARQLYRACSLALRPPLEDMERVETRTIPARSGPRPIRLLRPRAPAGPLPVMLFLHGGGFVLGGLDEGEAEARGLAARTPALVVQLAYRLAPESPFPAALEDACDALLWITHHAAAHGGDATRLVVAGSGAGGGLAAAVCRLAASEGRPRVALCVLLCPWLDLTLGQASVREFAHGFGLDAEDLAWFAASYLGDDADAGDPLLSPALAAAPPGLAPTFLLAAECDPLRDETRRYAGRLKDAGVPLDYALALNMPHAFTAVPHLIPSGAACLNGLDRLLARV
jgi:acetyl esterase